MAHPALLLANENIPAPLVRLLQTNGFDVQAVAELMPMASDRAVLFYAHQHGRSILTFDRDYGELVFARAVQPPPAIIYLRQGPQTMAEFARVITQLLTGDAQQWLGHLVVVGGRGVRRRPLPQPVQI